MEVAGGPDTFQLAWKCAQMCIRDSYDAEQRKAELEAKAHEAEEKRSSEEQKTALAVEKTACCCSRLSSSWQESLFEPPSSPLDFEKQQ